MINNYKTFKIVLFSAFLALVCIPGYSSDNDVPTEKIQQFLMDQNIVGLQKLKLDVEINKAEIQVDIDREYAKRVGLSTAQIAQSLRIELSGSRVKVSEICPGRTKTNFGKAAFTDKKKAKKFMSGFTLLEPRDIADAIMFALSVRWRSNISTIEISGTEQSPGGVPIIPVKDPILS